MYYNLPLNPTRKSTLVENESIFSRRLFEVTKPSESMKIKHVKVRLQGRR
jgi:hypothetical protein